MNTMGWCLMKMYIKVGQAQTHLRARCRPPSRAGQTGSIGRYSITAQPDLRSHRVYRRNRYFIDYYHDCQFDQ